MIPYAAATWSASDTPPRTVLRPDRSASTTPMHQGMPASSWCVAVNRLASSNPGDVHTDVPCGDTSSVTTAQVTRRRSANHGREGIAARLSSCGWSCPSACPRARRCLARTLAGKAVGLDQRGLPADLPVRSSPGHSGCQHPCPPSDPGPRQEPSSTDAEAHRASGDPAVTTRRRQARWQTWLPTSPRCARV